MHVEAGIQLEMHEVALRPQLQGLQMQLQLEHESRI